MGTDNNAGFLVLVALLVILMIALFEITTFYTEENGFTKDYTGQTYIDLTNMKICHNEDCSE